MLERIAWGGGYVERGKMSFMLVAAFCFLSDDAPLVWGWWKTGCEWRQFIIPVDRGFHLLGIRSLGEKASLAGVLREWTQSWLHRDFAVVIRITEQ